MFVPSNHLVKLGVGSAYQTRLDLSDRLYYPVGLDYTNPSLPMMGGSIANRAGIPVKLTDPNVAGNTGGYYAEFSPITGDPIVAVKKRTSDGDQFIVAGFDGQELMVEDPSLSGSNYTNLPRYMIKADGIIYDLLWIKSTDTTVVANGPYQHWEIGNGATQTPYDTKGVYAAGTNTYTPPVANTITADDYFRPVGRISFRPKSGASSQLIQDSISRVSGALDSMSRLLSSLHDEAKGPFANIILR